MADRIAPTGPVTGGSHGWPFAWFHPARRVGHRGGVLPSRAALRPHAGGRRGCRSAQTASGRWNAERNEFRTRVPVRRPTDPERFSPARSSGWNNVSAGFDGPRRRRRGPSCTSRGLRVAAVSGQAVGVRPPRQRFAGPVGLGSPNVRSPRSPPTTQRSYDIHPGVGSSPLAPNDPLGGLRVDRLIAPGGSQSAGRPTPT